MYDILKEIATANGWAFTYARNDFANLYDEIEVSDKPYIFLDPVTIEDENNDMNVLEATIHSGYFMLVMSSEIDDADYNDRYEDYIKPLIEGFAITLKDGIVCGSRNINFNLWKKTEVINAFDYNFDGLIITYNITIEE